MFRKIQEARAIGQTRIHIRIDYFVVLMIGRKGIEKTDDELDVY
jgi:hypothetical protein